MHFVVLLVLFFAPHPSIVLVLTSYYLRIHTEPVTFVLNLLVIYVLVFFACCSLMVCVVRDPGAVCKESGETANRIEPGVSRRSTGDIAPQEAADEGESVTEALLAPPAIVRTDSDEGIDEGWCRKCDAPKPERTHHCSICGRCILKMGMDPLLYELME